MAISKKQALAVVFSAASEYKSNLANRNLLFLSVDKHHNVHLMEASFDESNFKHLTGLKSGIAPKHFFSLCLDRRLSENDFEFAEDGTTQMKLEVLPLVVKKDLSARMLGDYNGFRPKLHTEKLAGGVNACVGFKRIEEKPRYAPNTLLNEDIRDSVTGRPDRIVLIYRKHIGEDDYSEIVFQAKKFDLSKIRLPEEFAYLKIPPPVEPLVGP